MRWTAALNAVAITFSDRFPAETYAPQPGKLIASTDIDDWARAEATPSTEEITRIRRLIARITTDLDDLSPDDRTHIERAVTAVRRHRGVTLGMPTIRRPEPHKRPE